MLRGFETVAAQPPQPPIATASGCRRWSRRALWGLPAPCCEVSRRLLRNLLNHRSLRLRDAVAGRGGRSGDFRHRVARFRDGCCATSSTTDRYGSGMPSLVEEGALGTSATVLRGFETVAAQPPQPPIATAPGCRRWLRRAPWRLPAPCCEVS